MLDQDVQINSSATTLNYSVTELQDGTLIDFALVQIAHFDNVSFYHLKVSS